MRNIFIVFVNTIRRSKSAIAVTAAAGILLCVIFNLMLPLYATFSQPGLNLGLCVYNETAFSADFKAYLADDLRMKLTEKADYDELSKMLVDRKISGIIEVENDEITATFLDDYANRAFVTAYLESYLSAVSVNPNARATAIPLTITSANSKTAQEAQQGAFRTSTGFFLSFSFILGLFIAWQIFNDRGGGVYSRVKASNMRTASYISGICLEGILCTLLQSGIFIGYLAISGKDIGMNFWFAALLCLLYSLFVVGFSLFCALVFKSQGSIIATVVGGSSIMCMIGGAYFPIATAPEFMQKLARVVPQYWFSDAVDRLQSGAGAGFHLLVLTLFALLTFILSGVWFAYEKS
ncbi:MAG: ABC transporter permease [Oscillospiraceae bacterium]|jgi:ABC-2 type transport system permease protein|nr:ABC transporter permease [Oscillospiraceae bacterium]